jgi:3-hydroxyacyl-CoA dehydrogenase
VVGIHFFSPVPMMKLVELVRGYRTSDETLAPPRNFAEEVGKTCVEVNRDVAGFVSNRLFSALSSRRSSWSSPAWSRPPTWTRCCKLGFGHAMGPLATVDLTGSTSAARGGEHLPRHRRREVLPAGADAAHGHRGRPGPQDRQGLLHY